MTLTFVSAAEGLAAVFARERLAHAGIDVRGPRALPSAKTLAAPGAMNEDVWNRKKIELRFRIGDSSKSRSNQISFRLVFS